MRRTIKIEATVDVECPPNVSGRELAEASLQVAMGWFATAGGWRARLVRVDSGTFSSSYTHAETGSESATKVTVLGEAP